MSAPSGRIVAFTPYGRRAGSSRARVFEWIDHLSLDRGGSQLHDLEPCRFSELLRDPSARFAGIGNSPHSRSNRGHRPHPPGVESLVLDGRAEERLLRSGSRGWSISMTVSSRDRGHGGFARRFRPKAPKIIRHGARRRRCDHGERHDRGVRVLRVRRARGGDTDVRRAVEVRTEVLTTSFMIRHASAGSGRRPRKHTSVRSGTNCCSSIR